jgi:diguanylate cyclase (GGDEF)-like protein
VSPEGRAHLRIVRAVVWGVAAAAFGVVAWALPEAVDFALDAPPEFWAMAVGALLVDVPLFGMTRPQDIRVRSTLSVCFTFAIFMLWGAAPAVVVQALAGAVTVVGQRYAPASGLYLVSRLILSTAAAELVVNLVDPRPVTTPGARLNGGDLLALLLLATVWLVVSYGLLTVARAGVSPQGVRQAIAEVRFDLLRTAVGVLLVSPLLTTIPDWWLLLVVVPLIVWNQLLREQFHEEQRLGREPVTGLLNQRGLAVGMRAMAALENARRGPRPFGIVLVNVESVLTVNRMLGRDLYEQVVSAASRRLADEYGDDRVARLSGEGIAVLMPDMTEDDAVDRARSAVAVLARRIDVDDVPFALDPCGGVALSPQHGKELGTLLAKAELAVTEARRRNLPAMLYVRQAAEVTQRRVALLRELRHALSEPDRQDEVAVLYQPKVEIGTGRLSGVEALVRWTHPDWGAVPTDELIEAIEPTEVMQLLTHRVLAMVAEQTRRWNDQGQSIRTAVNVSVEDLHDPDFVDELGALIRSSGIPPEQITIEITESILVSDAPRVARACDTLARVGVGLSLDDFGTGYASMRQLRQLPLTEVKIDGSYVRGFVDDPTDRAIVTSVHEMARALGVAVVAEGVEDRRTTRALASFAGMVGQGYYFGPPMTVDALQGWLSAVGPQH